MAGKPASPLSRPPPLLSIPGKAMKPPDHILSSELRHDRIPSPFRTRVGFENPRIARLPALFAEVLFFESRFHRTPSIPRLRWCPRELHMRPEHPFIPPPRRRRPAVRLVFFPKTFGELQNRHHRLIATPKARDDHNRQNKNDRCQAADSDTPQRRLYLRPPIPAVGARPRRFRHLISAGFTRDQLRHFPSPQAVGRRYIFT